MEGQMRQGRKDIHKNEHGRWNIQENFCSKYRKLKKDGINLPTRICVGSSICLTGNLETVNERVFG